MTSSDPWASTCSCAIVRKAARHVTQHYDRALAACGLTVTQYSILSHIGHLGPLTIGELAARLMMDRTTLARTLGPLERDGLVAVGADPQDARRRALSLTAAGRDRRAAAEPVWGAAQARFDAALGPASRDLHAVLETVLRTEFDPPGDALAPSPSR